MASVEPALRDRPKAGPFSFEGRGPGDAGECKGDCFEAQTGKHSLSLNLTAF
jgi:hypothetical protein